MANEKRLIDATPLIDECDECMRIEWNKSVYTTWAEAEEDFKNRLMDAPTVDAVEVVHGRWIMRGGKRYCSACQQKACVTRDTDDFWYTIGTNYCPNCGAKMDGDGNG